MPEQPKRYEWHDGREMAFEISERHPDLFKDVPPLSDILFVMDTEGKPKSKGRRVLARVSKISGKFVDLIDAGSRTYMIEWFKMHTEHLTRNQRYLVMAHELMHFHYDPDSGLHSIQGHDIEEFSLIADRFGINWTKQTRGDIPDIMAPDFSWGKIGQAQLKLVTGTGTEG